MAEILICRTADDVPKALARFQTDCESVTRWAFKKSCPDLPFVVFNAPFDCWTLQLSALRLGLLPFAFDMRKYGSRNVVDMYQELACDGCTAVLSRGQKALAAAIGLAVEDETDGDDIADLYAKGDFDGIAAHNRADVETLTALWQWRYPGRRGVIVDVETVAREDAPAFRRFIKPDSRLTDPKKIAASIDEKLSKAALDPWLNRIVCLGYEVVGVPLPKPEPEMEAAF